MVILSEYQGSKIPIRNIIVLKFSNKIKVNDAFFNLMAFLCYLKTRELQNCETF